MKIINQTVRINGEIEPTTESYFTKRDSRFRSTRKRVEELAERVRKGQNLFDDNLSEPTLIYDYICNHDMKRVKHVDITQATGLNTHQIKDALAVLKKQGLIIYDGGWKAK